MFGFSPVLNDEDREAHVSAVLSEAGWEETRRFIVTFMRLCEPELRSLIDAVADYYCANCGLWSDAEEWPCDCSKNANSPNMDEESLTDLFGGSSKEVMISIFSKHLQCTRNETYFELYEVLRLHRIEETTHDSDQKDVLLLPLPDDELYPLRRDAVRLAREVEEQLAEGQTTTMVQIARANDAQELAEIRDELFNALHSRRAHS
jgi:hypothetical protein